MGWISGEVLLLDQPSWTWNDGLYFALGLTMAALELAVQGIERKARDRC